jgi:Ca2+-transporting ATPase
LKRVRLLADQGLRVLAVAEGSVANGETAKKQHDYDFTPLGLVAFEDPLRSSVPGAVAQAREAGIAVAMIPGDHAATGLAIARQAGIDVDFVAFDQLEHYYQLPGEYASPDRRPIRLRDPLVHRH